MENKGGKTKYQQQQKAGGKPTSARLQVTAKGNTAEASEKARNREIADEIDGRFGFHRMVDVSSYLRHLSSLVFI